MSRLEQPVFIANLGAGSHAHSADKPAGKIRQYVAEDIFHHHQVEIPWLGRHVQRHRIDIAVAGLDIGMVRGHFVEQGVLVPVDARRKDLSRRPGRLLTSGAGLGDVLRCLFLPPDPLRWR